MMKYFIITMDTEGDNLWNWKNGDKITTNNTQYLQRFQNLCNNYAFKPVWLTNYEMIMDPNYVDFIKEVEENRQGELGMHLHAWNTPPEYELERYQNGAPYLIEYPPDIISKKIKTMTELLFEKTGIRPVSHRAGRWAMNQYYFDELINNGYLVDCSVTPRINWESSVGQTRDAVGTNYCTWDDKPHFISNYDGSGHILEVPMSIITVHRFFPPEEINIKAVAKNVYYAFKGDNLWLRPNGYNIRQMKHIIKKKRDSDHNCVMFMLHSSELMPGGSPTFKTIESINKLYNDVEELFAYASKLGYMGITLRDFAAKNKG